MTDDPRLPDDLFAADGPLPDDAALGAPLPDDWLAAAQAYHRPPAVAPVAEIEAAVAARLAHRVVPLHRRPAVRGVLALAATLLIGVLIGRATLGPGIPGGGSRSGGAFVATADGPTREAPAPSATVEVATQQHLARTEALLTAVRAATIRGRAPADLGPWARDLLTSTRLFLDSPVARDPAEHALLEELELLLMAVVQASASRRSADTDLLAQQLRRSQLLPRLRTLASPAADAAAPPISD